MSLLLTSVLLASTALPACSWDHPGVDPFTGSLVESVDRYTDIPADVRAVLKQRMATRQYDDLVTIRRDAIAGRDTYAPEIRDMHFGAGRVCRSVTRTRWAADHVERGLVYCASGHCLLVPTVCRNLSRIARLAQQPAGAAAPSPAGPGAVGSRGAAPALIESAGGDAGAAPLQAGGSGSSIGTADGDAAGGVVSGQAAQAMPVLNSVPAIAALTAAPGSFNTAAGVPTYPLGAVVPLANPGFIPGVSSAPTPAVPEAPAAMLWLLGLGGLAAARRLATRGECTQKV